MTATSTAPARNLGLDLLRLVAILLVIGNHLVVPPELSNGFLAAWVRGGWIGVDLFFVLSGYLVSGLLFKEHQTRGQVSLGRFLVRRGFKIYPAFWVMIAVSVAFLWWRGRPVPGRYLVGELLFVQNYLAHMWSHTWSLAVEEHFYFGLAGLTWLLLRRPGRNPFAILPLAFALIATASLAMRVWNATHYSDYHYSLDLIPTHLRIDSLFFGVLLSYLAHFHHLEDRLRWFPTWARIACGAALLVPAFVFDRESSRWLTVTGYNLFYVGSGLLVLGVVNLRGTTSRLVAALGALGATSYSIYLWHLPVSVWLAARFLRVHPTDPLYYSGYLAVAIPGAIVFGYVMARVIELPILHLRDNFYPSRHAKPETFPLRVSHSTAPSS